MEVITATDLYFHGTHGYSRVTRSFAAFGGSCAPVAQSGAKNLCKMYCAKNGFFFTSPRALIRPGRFDSRIDIPLPDVKARFEILKVHAKKVKMSEGDLHPAVYMYIVHTACTMLSGLLPDAFRDEILILCIVLPSNSFQTLTWK